MKKHKSTAFSRLKTDPLRGFWYADDGVGPAYHQAGMVSVPPTVQTPFSKRSLIRPEAFGTATDEGSRHLKPPMGVSVPHGTNSFFLKKESI